MENMMKTRYPDVLDDFARQNQHACQERFTATVNAQ